MSEPVPQQVSGFSLLLQLQRNAREATRAAELGFVIVNETRLILEYRQAVLFQNDFGIAAISSLPDVDRNAPYTQWLERLFKAIENKSEVGLLTPTDLPAAVAADWDVWLPESCLLIPLRKNSKSETVIGILLLTRESDWSEQDRALLQELAGVYGHAWGSFMTPGGLAGDLWRKTRQKRVRLVLLAILVSVMLLPLRLSVLAPAEIIAADPVDVRVSLEGVIDSFAVRPNQTVVAGQLLFELDATELKNRLNVARKARKVAEAEYRQAAQQAVYDPKSKVELKIRKGRLDAQVSEEIYISELLQRVQVRAPRAGVAVFSDTSDWIGRAVRMGERILTVADPALIEIEIHLPVIDMIPLQMGADTTLFLNVAPDRPLRGELSYLAYRAEVGVNSILSYRIKASLTEGAELPRIGLAGTAKLYGERVTLFYYLFRRPITFARQWLGW